MMAAVTPCLLGCPAPPSSVRSIRIPDYLWAEILRLAHESDRTSNKVAVEFLAEMAGVRLLGGRNPRARRPRPDQWGKTQPAGQPLESLDPFTATSPQDGLSKVVAAVVAVRKELARDQVRARNYSTAGDRSQ